MTSLGVYVINLQSRPDRLLQISEKLASVNVPFSRVEACTPNGLTSDYLSPSVHAIFESHMAVMRVFLESNSNFALILEDDASIDGALNFEKYVLEMQEGIDFLQIGFLTNDLVDKFEIAYFNTKRRFSMAIYNAIRSISPMAKMTISLGQRLVIQDHLRFSRGCVASNIQAGAHAYFISRRFAQGVLAISNIPFLAVDDLYMALGRMRTFTMLRLTSSIVGQGDFTSDVISRFKNA